VGLCLWAATSPARAEWHRASNGHFVIYADMPAKNLQAIADRLERFDAAMRFIIKPEESRPVTIYVVPAEDVGRLAGSRGVGGFYSPRTEESTIVTPARTAQHLDAYGFDARTILQHEYAHHMLMGDLHEILPSWANEGMAEFFGTADVKSDGRVLLGAPPRIRGFALLGNNRWTAREMLTSETRLIRPSEVAQRYARGWLLVHYLLLGGERPGQYAQYISAVSVGTPPGEAGEQVFGDLGKLNTDMQQHLRARSYRLLELKKDQLAGAQPVTVEALSPGAAAITPYRVRSATGVSREEAVALADEAAPIAAHYFDDPFVQRAYAEMLYDAHRYDDAIAAADRALAVEPANVMAMVYRGRALARRWMAEGDLDLLRQARSWFLQANRADPNHPQPFVSYYDTFVSAGEAPNAAAQMGLLRAVVLAPQVASLRLRVGHLLLNEGDVEAARMMLAAVAFNPHTAEDNPARDAVRMMDEGKSAQSIFAEVGARLLVSEFAEAADDGGGDPT